MSAMTTAALEVDKISLAFGGLKAVSDFTLALPRGGLEGLIGPNGAGKTTIFNLLTGVYQPQAGTIKLGGRTINGLKPYQIAAAGMARTFQNIRLFGELPVLDNVRIACHLRTKRTMAEAILRTPSHIGEERAILERAHMLLDLFGLDNRADEQAKNLPYGDQRRLEIARALATDPKVLLLDEPAAGMNPQEKRALRGLIDLVRKDFGLSVLLIEHDMGLVMDICERITVVDHGVTIAVGTPNVVQNDKAVIEAYLGAPAGSA
jgi:branched-chain amino acid transport system ATP-binding protein